MSRTCRGSTGRNQAVVTAPATPLAVARRSAATAWAGSASRLDLSSFAGKSIKPRFSLELRQHASSHIGWFVDDITVYTCDRLKVVAGSVKITGTAKVGKKLKAKLKSWAPAGVTLQVPVVPRRPEDQRRQGQVLQADRRGRGHKISVKVTGTKASYASATAKSKKTGEVKQQ